ncbi:hypothetical protein ACFDTO_33205 [Microbacteriaceae bacterium 4G12]
MIQKIFSFASVVFIIIIFYIFSVSFLIYLLSLVSILEIHILRWQSIIIFSIGTFLWMVPYELISLLYSIRFRNKTVLNLFVTLLNVILFTFFIIWLDTKVKGISFSTQGLVVYIILVFVILIGIQKKGEQLEKDER